MENQKDFIFLGEIVKEASNCDNNYFPNIFCSIGEEISYAYQCIGRFNDEFIFERVYKGKSKYLLNILEKMKGGKK